MAIEAPISKYKKNGLLIYIAVCLAVTAWFAYDGYLNEDFRKENTDEDGNPNSTLVINQKAPPFGVGIAVILGAYLLIVRNKKIVADENELVFSETDKVLYDSIEKIDRTHFDSKGYFVVTYKDKGGNEVNRKISSRRYDNLPAVLEHLVAKIS